MTGVVKSIDTGAASPFFSICIPQYNRTDFLIKELASFSEQTFRDFEICISDDNSNDGKERSLIDHLTSSGMRFVYDRNPSNLRYDGNLRRAIGLSAGQYLLLMGNDDALFDAHTLQFLHDQIVRAQPVAVAITNYVEIPTGRVYRRAPKSCVLEGGAQSAVREFRNFNFVSGLILDGPKCRASATTAVDGSEMYQMYLGIKLISQGSRVLRIEDICVKKDLQIEGQTVDSYRTRPPERFKIMTRSLPLGRLLEVLAKGLEGSPDYGGAMLSGGLKLYIFTFPFWMFEYRRTLSWSYAAGVALGLAVSKTTRNIQLPTYVRIVLTLVSWVTFTSALLLPITLFDVLRSRLYALAKR